MLLLASVGCKKPAGPKTTETADLSAPARSVNKLMPAALPTETSIATEPTAAAAAPVETPAPAPPKKTYTIRKGDTLWSLAKKFYGNGNRWKEIAVANDIADESKLPIGKVLRIP